jgi:hypothetical protein
MSKHSQRRARRAEYHSMLDVELDQERPFVRRVLRTLDSSGEDIAPDGRPIRADFWRYIESRRKAEIHTARAGLCLVEKAISLIRVR